MLDSSPWRGEVQGLARQIMSEGKPMTIKERMAALAKSSNGGGFEPTSEVTKEVSATPKSGQTPPGVSVANKLSKLRMANAGGSSVPVAGSKSGPSTAATSSRVGTRSPPVVSTPSASTSVPFGTDEVPRPKMAEDADDGANEVKETVAQRIAKLKTGVAAYPPPPAHKGNMPRGPPASLTSSPPRAQEEVSGPPPAPAAKGSPRMSPGLAARMEALGATAGGQGATVGSPPVSGGISDRIKRMGGVGMPGMGVVCLPGMGVMTAEGMKELKARREAMLMEEERANLGGGGSELSDSAVATKQGGGEEGDEGASVMKVAMEMEHASLSRATMPQRRRPRSRPQKPTRPLKPQDSLQQPPAVPPPKTSQPQVSSSPELPRVQPPLPPKPSSPESLSQQSPMPKMPTMPKMPSPEPPQQASPPVPKRSPRMALEQPLLPRKPSPKLPPEDEPMVLSKPPQLPETVLTMGLEEAMHRVDGVSSTAGAEVSAAAVVEFEKQKKPLPLVPCEATVSATAQQKDSDPSLSQAEMGSEDWGVKGALAEGQGSAGGGVADDSAQASGAGEEEGEGIVDGNTSAAPWRKFLARASSAPSSSESDGDSDDEWE